MSRDAGATSEYSSSAPKHFRILLVSRFHVSGSFRRLFITSYHVLPRKLDGNAGKQLEAVGHCRCTLSLSQAAWLLAISRQMGCGAGLFSSLSRHSRSSLIEAAEPGKAIGIAERSATTLFLRHTDLSPFGRIDCMSFRTLPSCLRRSPIRAGRHDANSEADVDIKQCAAHPGKRQEPRWGATWNACNALG